VNRSYKPRSWIWIWWLRICN